LAKEDEISWLRSIAQLPFRLTCAGLLMLAIHSRPASAEVPDGTWLFANRVAVEVFECSGHVCGRIVWLLRPRTPDGQPDVDRLNPDPTLRQRPLCGLTIIWGCNPTMRAIGRTARFTTRKTATRMMSPQNAPHPTGYPHAFIAESLSSAAPKS
jgi:hypothetical protein